MQFSRSTTTTILKQILTPFLESLTKCDDGTLLDKTTGIKSLVNKKGELVQKGETNDIN